jgi:hypothetical protein
MTKSFTESVTIDYSASSLLYLSHNGKVVPDSFSGETHLGEMLQASILTYLVCTVLSVMITVSWSAKRGQSASSMAQLRGAEATFSLPTLGYSGLHLCPA